MFCRFGSLDVRRPVAVTVWLNEVWMRPVFLLTSFGSESIYVPASFASDRYSSLSPAMGYSTASSVSTLTSVEYPVLVFLDDGRPSFSKRIC